jgi:hypothetical protein
VRWVSPAGIQYSTKVAASGIFRACIPFSPGSIDRQALLFFSAKTKVAANIKVAAKPKPYFHLSKNGKVAASGIFKACIPFLPGSIDRQALLFSHQKQK